MHGTFDVKELGEAASMMGEASMTLMSAEPTPPCLLTIPDPLLAD